MRTGRSFFGNCVIHPSLSPSLTLCWSAEQTTSFRTDTAKQFQTRERSEIQGLHSMQAVEGFHALNASSASALICISVLCSNMYTKKRHDNIQPPSGTDCPQLVGSSSKSYLWPMLIFTLLSPQLKHASLQAMSSAIKSQSYHNYTFCCFHFCKKLSLHLCISPTDAASFLAVYNITPRP